MIEKLRLKMKQISSGLPGTLMLEAQELVDELTTYLREEHRFIKQRKEKEPEYEHAFDVQIQRWYNRRSLNANNLAWELATRLGQADGVKKEVVYYAIKELVELPRDEYKGIFVSRPSGDLTTVEFARVIQQLVIECQTHVPAVDIRDIWILFTEWRFRQETDPLEGTYYGPEDYKEKHPCCEACGRFLLHTVEGGDQAHGGELSHIVSVGAGGRTGARDDWVWLILCSKCHICTQHANGWEDLLILYAHLRPKVDRARERAGKKPLAVPDALPGPVSSAPVIRPPADEAVPAAQAAEIVTRVFEGEIVGELAEAAEDPAKERMLSKLKGLQKRVEKEQPPAPAAEPVQPGLFDEPQKKMEPATEAAGKPSPGPTAVDPPAPSYRKDGSFDLPADF